MVNKFTIKINLRKLIKLRIIYENLRLRFFYFQTRAI